MSGSNTWRLYRDDSGEPYSISIDKSNASATIGTTSLPLVPPRIGNHDKLPCNISPRYVAAFNRDNVLQKGKFIVATTALASAILQADDRYIRLIDSNGALNVWIVTGYYGEKHRNLPHYHSQVDTGLQDGTVSN
jgi:hypothetical protein